jgi:hypothetical protein
MIWDLSVETTPKNTGRHTGMFTKIIENRRYRCQSLPLLQPSAFEVRQRTHLHLQTNGSAIKDTLVIFNKTPFMAGNAKKNTSRCGGVEWKVFLEDTRWFRNVRGAVRGRGLFDERSAFRTVRGRARVRGRNMVSWSAHGL